MLFSLGGEARAARARRLRVVVGLDGWGGPRSRPRAAREGGVRPAGAGRCGWSPDPTGGRPPLTPTPSTSLLTTNTTTYIKNPLQMAGKSTIMRCVASVAVLSLCGLFSPVAKTTRVPRLDQVILRAFAKDSPSHGRSSFAVEMDEMRAVLSGATARSLVLVSGVGKGGGLGWGECAVPVGGHRERTATTSSPPSSTQTSRTPTPPALHHPFFFYNHSTQQVDELGKGTEACAGSALAGAMLEHLAAETRCVGIFATHLHALLDLPLGGDVARLKMLTTTADGGRRVPAWKVAPGVSTESLALETAAGAGVPGRVVARAAQLYGLVRGVAVVGGGGEGEEAGAVVSGGGEAATAAGAGGGAAPSGGGLLAAATPAPEDGAPPPPATPTLAGTAVSIPAPPPLPRLAITLHEAAAVLHATAAALVRDPALPAATILPPGTDPPAVASSASCVYVVRREDGYFYCGETDALLARLDAHRARPPVRGGAGLAAAYVALPSKTVARAVEAATIQRLLDVGVPMLSVADAKGGRVGRGAVGVVGQQQQQHQEQQQEQQAGVMAA
jgi:hypothetical protein